MSRRKRCRVEKDWYHLFSMVNIDQYLTNIDKGIMKFVNRELYQKYKGFDMNYDVLLPTARYFCTPQFWYLADWYEQFTGNKFKKLIENSELIIKYDYPKIYQIYFFSPNWTRKLYSKLTYISHFRRMVDQSAVKCIDFMIKHRFDVVVKDIAYVVINGNSLIFRQIMDEIVKSKYHLDIGRLMHLCIDKYHDHILEDMVGRYGFTPDSSVIRRINGPHFNSVICKAAIEGIKIS
jgi:hypothetical protein